MVKVQNLPSLKIVKMGLLFKMKYNNNINAGL